MDTVQNLGHLDQDNHFPVDLGYLGKDLLSDIGGHRVELTPGKKHRVVLNVRDVLKAAGLLV